ncbi:hypothetical protein BJ165DRAFT_1333369, partial [Panaeolus papilionaceus]
MFAWFALPFISGYSFKVQALILLPILAASYLHRRTRHVFGAIASLYIVFKLAIPTAQWIWYIFTGIAMLGFYIHFFSVAMGYVLYGLGVIFGEAFLTALLEELEK